MTDECECVAVWRNVERPLACTGIRSSQPPLFRALEIHLANPECLGVHPVPNQKRLAIGSPDHDCAGLGNLPLGPADARNDKDAALLRTPAAMKRNLPPIRRPRREV